MGRNSRLHNSAKRMHTHAVVFNPESDEEDCAVRAMMGWSTKAIASVRGLSIGQVSYRIGKAKLIGERARFRGGQSAMSKLLYRLGRDAARRQVQKKIAPLFKALSDR